MAQVIKWTMRYDAWIDNSLELFGCIAERIQQQHPQVVQIRWETDALEVTIHDEQHFLDLLDTAGWDLLGALGWRPSEQAGKHLKDLRQIRNHSYLEHGYQRVDRKGAERLLRYAETLCEEVLEQPLRAFRERVTHLSSPAKGGGPNR